MSVTDLIIGHIGRSDPKLKGNGDDTINGLAGNDLLTGRDGDDIIDGGDGNDLLRGFVGADDLRGGAGDDVLRGGTRDQENSYGKARDTLSAGNGNDRLYGGYGDDTMTGGNGTDRFVYRNSDDSLAIASDKILDFQDGVDNLVFAGNLRSRGDLHFIGQQQFSNTAGEIRYFVGNDNQSSIVLIDLDGDSQADMAITLNGVHTLALSDFSF